MIFTSKERSKSSKGKPKEREQVREEEKMSTAVSGGIIEGINAGLKMKKRVSGLKFLFSCLLADIDEYSIAANDKIVNAEDVNVLRKYRLSVLTAMSEIDYSSDTMDLMFKLRDMRLYFMHVAGICGSPEDTK